jgi:hypothetical protein
VPDDKPEVLTPAQMEQVREEERKRAEAEGDAESDELFADMLAGAIVGGHQRAVKNFCAAQEPPKRAAEPSEMCLEWERYGVQKKCRRLMGSKKLSENAKLVIGVVGVTISMVWNAEEIPEAERKPAAAAPAAPRPAPAPRPTPPTPHPIVPPAPPAPKPAAALVSIPGPGEAAAGRFK